MNVPIPPLLAELSAESNLRIRSGASLAELTTLRIGGRPAALLECTSTEAIVRAVTALDAVAHPVLIVGGGSNLVVAEGNLDLVAVAVRNTGIEFGAATAEPQVDGARTAESASDEAWVRAEAGVVWDDLVSATIEAGWGGLECLSGIPGSVGATPVQNVGAYGVEVAQLLRRVRLLDRRSGEVRWVDPADLALDYRTSILKNDDRAVVLEVEFRLNPGGVSEPIRYSELAAALEVAPGERAEAAQVREVVLRLRRSKGMVLEESDHDTWSAGSFFTNPVIPSDALDTVRERVRERLGSEMASAMPAFGTATALPGSEDQVKLSAGWLIERAGFGKGYPGEHAPARLSTKHTLALTNRGGATADDIIALARQVQHGVEEAFGVRLHPEPVWIGCAI